MCKYPCLTERYRYDSELQVGGGTYRVIGTIGPVGHAYGFFWRCRAINDIAHLTSYRDAIGVPCIRAQHVVVEIYHLCSVRSE